MARFTTRTPGLNLDRPVQLRRRGSRLVCTPLPADLPEEDWPIYTAMGPTREGNFSQTEYRIAWLEWILARLSITAFVPPHATKAERLRRLQDATFSFMERVPDEL